MMIFNQILDYPEEKKTVPMLHAICQHTGDVMKCMDYALTQCFNVSWIKMTEK